MASAAPFCRVVVGDDEEASPMSATSPQGKPWPSETGEHAVLARSVIFCTNDLTGSRVV
ncbi:MAG: hypothetical protein R2838_23960 [Caldilineaceae bacterium]